MKTLWEGEPTRITVNPASMVLTAWNKDRIEELRKKYWKIEGGAFTAKEWDSCRIVEIREFTGEVEVLTKDGKRLAVFSGSDEYGGHVNNVWKITQRLYKEGLPDLVFGLWTTSVIEE